MVKVICAFPGVGKTYFVENCKDSKLTTCDSDSSKFSWIDGPGSPRNTEFPANYIKHIQEKMGEVDFVLCSTHKAVRAALVAAGIKFHLVYPDKELKEEYLERFKVRGNDQKFINVMKSQWDNFIDDLEKQEGCVKTELGAGVYLADTIQTLTDKG